MILTALLALLSLAWVPRVDSDIPHGRASVGDVSLGEEVTADIVIHRCLQYRVLIDRWNPDFNLDPALVMAVMAQESHCAPGAHDPSGVGSVGLMQVIPRSWTTTAGALEDPATNIYWGMRILWLTMNDEKHNPGHSVRLALAAYNCGWQGVEADRCGSTGGLHYAERVLTFWYPRVKNAIAGVDKVP